MPDLGQLLRDTMLRHQDDAPAVDGLLSAARQRHRRRQTLLAAGPVTLAVAAVLVATLALSNDKAPTRTADRTPVVPSLTEQGSLDDQLFEVQAPTLSVIVGGIGAPPRDPCPTAAINAHGELRQTYDGVVGVIVIDTTKDCSVFANGTPTLVDADGHALQVPYANPNPVTAEFDKDGLRADFNAGQGRIGFAWRGSWCGPAAAALQLPLSQTPQPHPSSGPTLSVPLSGPSPTCTGSSSATFVPGYVHGVGWPIHPMDSGVLPAEPSWSALKAAVTVDSLTLSDVRATVTLRNTSGQSVVLQPCPRFTIAIDNEYADGSYEPQHDAEFPCGSNPVIPANASRTYTLPGLDFSTDTDPRTPTRRTLVFAFAELQPVRVTPPSTSEAAATGFVGVQFGTTQADAEQQLIQMFGPPKTASQPQNLPAACGIDTATQWPDMTAYYFKGNFVGYIYQRSTPLNGQTVITPGGLYIGEPLAQAQTAGGRAFRWSYAQGGSWTLQTPQGELVGNLTDVPPNGNIKNIAAGSLGCAAMVP